MKNEKIDYIMKFMLLVNIKGNSTVGKTNIINSICGKPFQTKNMTTLGFLFQFEQFFLGLEFETKKFTIDEKIISVQIWDTGNLILFLQSSISWIRKITQHNKKLLLKCKWNYLSLFYLGYRIF